jgi:hypothetical protein
MSIKENYVPGDSKFARTTSTNRYMKNGKPEVGS